MPPIPTYKKQVMPSGRTGEALMPMDIANTGEGAQWQGVEKLGQGVSDFGRFMFRIQQDERERQDLVNSANAESAFEISMRDLQVETGNLNSIEEINKAREDFPKLYDQRAKEIITGSDLSADAQAHLTASITRSKETYQWNNWKETEKKVKQINQGNLNNFLTAQYGTEPVPPIKGAPWAEGEYEKAVEVYQLQHTKWQGSFNGGLVAYGNALGADEVERQKITKLTTLGQFDRALEETKNSKHLLPTEISQLNSHIESGRNLAKAQTEYVAKQFENNLNDQMIKIDTTPNMTPEDFKVAADGLMNNVLASNLDGTHKMKLIKELKQWERGEGEIDYDRLRALDQEIDIATRTGIVDPTTKDRINRARMEGAFGPRNKGGAQKYSDMVRRFNNIKFDERLKAVDGIVQKFEKENSDEPALILLFHQAKNKILADNPDMSIRDVFAEVSGLAVSYVERPIQQILFEEMKEKYKQIKIDQIIKRGGKKYKVTGFDTDGTPLVDEVK